MRSRKLDSISCHPVLLRTHDFRKAFDPTAESYGHGNNKTGKTTKSVLHPDLKTIPRVPQVQLIGNGTVYDHEGLAEVWRLRFWVLTGRI